MDDLSLSFDIQPDLFALSSKLDEEVYEKLSGILLNQTIEYNDHRKWLKTG